MADDTPTNNGDVDEEKNSNALLTDIDIYQLRLNKETDVLSTFEYRSIPLNVNFASLTQIPRSAVNVPFRVLIRGLDNCTR